MSSRGLHDGRRRSGFVTLRDLDDLQRLWVDEPARAEAPAGAGPAAAADDGVRELCHDLRQPLAISAALAAELDRDPALAATARARLALLRQELDRLSVLVTQTLAPRAPGVVDLAELTRAGAQGRPSVELVLRAAPRVVGDPVQLARLIDNLLSNARSAAGADGPVRLTLDEAAGVARLQVEDGGGADRHDEPSCGLGLLIVEGIVRRHGGTLEATDSALGGARVVVGLPLAAAPAGAQDGGADA